MLGWEPREPAILLRVEKLELEPQLLRCILNGDHVTGVYDSLPLEQLLVLEQKAQELPGLRYVLRRQRGRFLLTVLAGQRLEDKEVKGMP